MGKIGKWNGTCAVRRGRTGDVILSEGGEDQTDPSYLNCHLKPWWYIQWSLLLLRAISGTKILLEQGFVLMSMTHVSTQGHEWYLWPVLQPEAMLMSLAILLLGAILMWITCALTWSHGVNCLQRTFLVLRSYCCLCGGVWVVVGGRSVVVMVVVVVCALVRIHVPVDYKEQGNYFCSDLDDCRCQVENIGKTSVKTKPSNLQEKAAA